MCSYGIIARNFSWCKFSHKLEISLRIKFRNLNFRNLSGHAHAIAKRKAFIFYIHTRGVFSNYAKIYTTCKFPAIRYLSHTHTLSRTLSLTHTHTHTHTQKYYHTSTIILSIIWISEISACAQVNRVTLLRQGCGSCTQTFVTQSESCHLREILEGL